MALSEKREALIWKALNETRGKIEPSEYKNYIFGIMFYKYLSDQARKWCHNQQPSWSDLWRQDPHRASNYMKEQLGYVIQPGDLFSDWQAAIDHQTFKVTMVADALQRFNQHIAPQAQEALSGIFADMDLNSNRIGSDTSARTATLTNMINLMSHIEVDDDSDVIGDLYEFLIGMFAASAGAKAGEFYTPHQVSEIMARILTTGREDLESYTLYDPAMGSGSLLLTTASYMRNAAHTNQVEYYGQELITTTYNLARMNLLMHGVAYDDIHLRNTDTLADDWPDLVFNGIHVPERFDAVMANPPYSLHWDNENRKKDPRFLMGVAPKSRADYAFLLQGLYHLNHNGRMAIVLPHGVLFRSGAEGEIRKNLVNHHNISAIIGLPEKIFTNTGMPTVILILEAQRTTDDILFIDASKEFEKTKNINKLCKQNVDKIVQTFLQRNDVPKYAHVASMAEIVENDYNLNLTRYVNTFEAKPQVAVPKLVDDLQELNHQETELTSEIQAMMNELSGSTSDEQKTLELLKQVFKQ
ncbi:type I restriction-modification system subunit M [Fructilactobacillus carniphilus]|uniref:site-specific DNA-methyltransferase (adenine-specific) n=1 Tax=Fructilactobacillus carniphilus TaxID=2940297 RepID=A0ABY5BVX4_9LACO|nr:type I restriction-modification system subunit M [Fructilactobacillus carniphilus]USS90652.1 type I restriction-modification system subunit M [Fructilactobacillus carniphilus]